MAAFTSDLSSEMLVEVESKVQWCFSNGIVMGSPHSDETRAHPETNTAIHAPFALRPYQYPVGAMDMAKSLAPLFNELVDSISRDSDWLVAALNHTAKSDEFTGRLLDIFKSVIATPESRRQRAVLALNRSDYMLHDVSGDDRKVLQVEINTISSSFGSLSTRIADLHRTLSGASTSARIPENTALAQLAMGLHAAHKEYIRQQGTEEQQQNSNDSPLSGDRPVAILFVVQAAERNFADQRALEHELLRTFGVRCIRATLTDMGSDSNSPISVDAASGVLRYNGVEISVVYYRAGYTPNDYHGEAEWRARSVLEGSVAIKCPDIAYHLVGTKKVQQLIAAPGVLERFVSSDKASQLRTCFAGLYNLDPSEAGSSRAIVDAVVKEAISRPLDFVLKPQREGGGNNYYKEEMVHMLRTMNDEERSAYILMERIRPPSQTAQLVRGGKVMETQCVCELGIYGIYLRDGDMKPAVNEYGGYLLRVKPVVADEGGVAAGFAVLGCPELV